MAGYRKLGRTSSQRKAMLRSLVTALLFNGKIVTTEARKLKPFLYIKTSNLMRINILFFTKRLNMNIDRSVALFKIIAPNDFHKPVTCENNTLVPN